MSYRDPERGYKGISYGAGAMAVAGLFYLLRMTSVTNEMRHEEAKLTTPAAVEDKLLRDNRRGALYTAIQQHYPEDFEALATQIANYARDGQTPAQLDVAARAFLAAAQQQHRAEFVQAPHDALADYRQAEIAVVGDLRSTDAHLCAEYLNKGGITSDAGSGDLRVALQQRGWEADAAGRDTPAGRDLSRPAPATWRRVADTMVAHGITQAEVAAYFQPAAGQPLDANRQCAAGLAFLNAVDDLPDREADQLYGYLVSHS